MNPAHFLPVFTGPVIRRRRPARVQADTSLMPRFSLALAFVLLLASTVHAQPVSKWTSRVYNVGASQPLSPPVDFVLGTNVACGVDPATITATPTNPLKMAWDDPAATGKACVYSDPGNGPLLSTPFGGSFEATLTATNTAGTSAESARAPFTHPGVPPPAPTGVRPVR